MAKMRERSDLRWSPLAFLGPNLVRGSCVVVMWDVCGVLCVCVGVGLRCLGCF